MDKKYWRKSQHMLYLEVQWENCVLLCFVSLLVVVDQKHSASCGGDQMIDVDKTRAQLGVASAL